MSTRAVSNGYTLLELLVVLTVVAVVAAAAAATLGPRSDTAELKLATSRLASDLRLAHAMARERFKPITVQLDINAGRWKLDAKHHGELGQDLTMVFAPTIAGASLIFFPDGSSTGGVVTLLSAESHRDISIDWLTGSVAGDR